MNNEIINVFNLAICDSFLHNEERRRGDEDVVTWSQWQKNRQTYCKKTRSISYFVFPQTAKKKYEKFSHLIKERIVLLYLIALSSRFHINSRSVDLNLHNLSTNCHFSNSQGLVCLPHATKYLTFPYRSRPTLPSADVWVIFLKDTSTPYELFKAKISLILGDFFFFFFFCFFFFFIFNSQSK